MKHTSFLLLIFLVMFPSGIDAQTVSPVVVETLDATPTLVHTGKYFTLTYRIRYLDLSDIGEKIIIHDDKIRGGFLSLPAEVDIVGFDADREEVSGKETSKYLVFTLRVVAKKKGTVKLPKAKLEWSIQRAGQSEEKAENQKPIEADREVYINYVTTITQDPYLDLRDRPIFGGGIPSFYFWLTSRVLSPLAALVLVVLPVVYWLRGKPRVEPGSEPAKPESEAEIDSPEAKLAFGGTYRRFFRELKKIGRDYSPFEGVRGDKEKMLELERKLYVLVHDLLSSRVAGIDFGDTPAVISEKIAGFRGSYGFGLAQLLNRLVAYDNDIASRSFSAFGDGGIDEEVRSLKINARLLTRRWRVFYRLSRKVGRSGWRRP